MKRTVYRQFRAILSWHCRKIADNACGCWKLTTPGSGQNEILRMSFSNAFCQKETCAFWLEFHSNLFLWAQLASSQHLFMLWFGSKQWRAIYWSNDHPFQWPLRWRHNGRDVVTNHQPHDCLLNRLFRRRSKKTSKLRDTGLCVENSPGTGEFPAQTVSNAGNVSISWRHHDLNMQNTAVAKNHTSQTAKYYHLVS